VLGIRGREITASCAARCRPGRAPVPADLSSLAICVLQSSSRSLGKQAIAGMAHLQGLRTVRAGLRTWLALAPATTAPAAPLTVAQCLVKHFHPEVMTAPSPPPTVSSSPDSQARQGGPAVVRRYPPLRQRSSRRETRKAVRVGVTMPQRWAKRATRCWFNSDRSMRSEPSILRAPPRVIRRLWP